METEQAIVVTDAAAIFEKAVVEGDLSKMTPAQRVAYYKQTCDSLGLNPWTKPFQYIVLSGKLTLYPTRVATDQLRKNHGVSVTKLEKEMVGDVYTITAYGLDKDGRSDSSIGAVNIAALKGDSLANALMKAETKAKRRLTLSLVGLGWLDETEIESIPDAHAVEVNIETGEIQGPLSPVTPPGKTFAFNTGMELAELWHNWDALVARAAQVGIVPDGLKKDATVKEIVQAGCILKAAVGNAEREKAK